MEILQAQTRLINKEAYVSLLTAILSVQMYVGWTLFRYVCKYVMKNRNLMPTQLTLVTLLTSYYK